MKSDILKSNEATIQNRIYMIHGNQVMVDRDLAELYQVETKRLNEQVKRNIERFPEDFRFVLNNDEKNELVANCDQFKTLKHSTLNPAVFMEQRRTWLGKSECLYTTKVASPGVLIEVVSYVASTSVVDSNINGDIEIKKNLLGLGV